MYHAVCAIKRLMVSLKCLSDLSHREFMSALGQKQTFMHVHMMSALPPKADITQHGSNVRFVPKAEVGNLKG